MSTPRRPNGDEPKAPKKKKKRRNWRWLGYTVLVLLGLFIGACGLVGTVVYKAYKTLPVYNGDYDPALTSVVYDNKDEKVYELADAENRKLVSLADVPKPIQQALIATEDARFYDHFGVDLWRVGGAVWANIKYVLGVSGSQLEGASTITMQLTRNAFLTPDQNMMRKIQEALIAVQLERRYTKDEILERYLNQVAFGHHAYGIEAAAETYFSKPAKDLTLSEGALLVGILKGTSFYDPLVNMEGAMNRRAVVLNQMVKYHYLDAAEAERIKDEPLDLHMAEVTSTSTTFTGDWYVDYVMDILTNKDLSAKYGTPLLDDDALYHKGLQIYTALDRSYQEAIGKTVPPLMEAGTKDYGAKEVPQAAVVVMNHTNGKVLAIYGGLEHKEMRSFNRATDAYRQPGSTMKPVTAYLPAIDTLGWGPATVIDDSPPQLNYPKKDNVWPENYEYSYAGLKNMRYAVEQSINAMAVRTEIAIGPEVGVQYAHKLGLNSVSSTADNNLALPLGGITKGVTPLDMTAAYGVLGSLGLKVDPVVITKIVDKNGQVIFEANPKKTQAVSKDSAWLMVDVMKGSILRGTASTYAKGWHNWPAAGKTGTTEVWQDAWFIGFTPEIVTGVWTGYDNNNGVMKTLPGVPGWMWTGAGPPTKIWTALMDQFVKQKPADWPRPSGVTAVEVCKTSGMLPSPLCPKDQIITDYFRKDHIPDKVDNILTTVKVVWQPFLDPKTKQPIVDSKTKKPVNRFYLWKDGCAGTPEVQTLIKRPDTYVKHPTDPYNFGRYWPADWYKEVPTEYCTPVAAPPTDPNNPGTQPPGTQPGNPGTQPPVTQPPVTQPPVETPPGTQPPGQTPPENPGTQPPGTQPPGTPTPPGAGG